MSSAPPGWHLQPDGRERFWDGQRWTDEFRTPGSAPTEQIPLDETRDMPAAGSGAYGGSAQGPQSQPGQGAYPPPPSGSYGQPGYSTPGYGQQPGYGDGGPLSDKPRGSGWAKGCLIALLVVAILAAILVVAGVWFFRSASDAVSDAVATSVPTEVPTELPSELPTDLPTGLPTDLPTELPTGLPTDLPSLPGQGATAEAGIGEEFTLGPATIQSGWTVEDVTLGFSSVTMQAVPNESGGVPLIFDLVFFEGDTDVTRTTCSVPLEPAGEAVDVACVPVRGFTDGIDRVRASGVGGG